MTSLCLQCGCLQILWQNSFKEITLLHCSLMSQTKKILNDSNSAFLSNLQCLRLCLMTTLSHLPPQMASTRFPPRINDDINTALFTACAQTYKRPHLYVSLDLPRVVFNNQRARKKGTASQHKPAASACVNTQAHGSHSTTLPKLWNLQFVSQTRRLSLMLTC